MFREISKRNRLFVLLIGLLLVSVYFVPIWQIILKAPQYRDGLSMNIWLSKITGGGEFDIQNINLLNHYVGMREIHADDFVEFLYMPYILGVMILGAVVTFVFPRLIMVYSGIFCFALAAIVGLYDFHKWEYEYGHNLDPEAALSIPGISFEPPLIACKAMMNFNTCSWPHIGASILILSGAILTYIAFDEARRKKV